MEFFLLLFMTAVANTPDWSHADTIRADTGPVILSENFFTPKRLYDREGYDEWMRDSATGPISVQFWPDTLTENTRYGAFSYGGTTRTFLVEQSDTSFTLRLDLDADGNLAEEVPCPLVRGSVSNSLAVKFNPPLVPEPFMIALPTNSDGTLRGRAWEFRTTHRSGAIQLEDASVKFVVVGELGGTYNSPERAVFFDLNGDGEIVTTEYSDERLLVSDRFVVLRGHSFEFTVSEDGGHIRLDRVDDVAERVPLDPGNPAPDFQFETIYGTRHSLSDFRGKLVLIYGWSTSCAPCRDQLPYLLDVWGTCRSSDFEIIGVNRREPTEIIAPYAFESEMTWIQALDPNGEIFRAYRTDKTPTFILVGKDGTILDRNLRGKALVSRIQDVAECHDWMLPNVSRLIQ